MRIALRAFLLFGLAASAHARITDFNDGHFGFSFGGGTYFNWVSSLNANDPLPSMAPTGVTVSGGDSGYLLPVRFGFFFGTGMVDTEIYGRYMAATGRSFTYSGGATGSGGVSYGSMGAGISFGFSLFRSARFRLPLVVNAEYVSQKLTVSSTEGTVDLSAPSILAGGGLYPQVFIGDMWVLGIFSGYQYGLDNSWTVTTPGTIFGRTFTAGALTNASGLNATSQYGGFLFELVFRLNIR